jgi:hypothetical protein
MLRSACLLLVCLSLSGCSVFMAASGSEDLDLTSVGQGSSRAEVEALLGKPISFVRKDFGDIATYQYFTNDEPSYLRAALWAGLDLITAGFAELVIFRMEALQGDKHTVVVAYDLSKQVLAIEHSHDQAPLKSPEAYVGLSSEETEPETEPESRGSYGAEPAPSNL